MVLKNAYKQHTGIWSNFSIHPKSLVKETAPLGRVHLDPTWAERTMPTVQGSQRQVRLQTYLAPGWGRCSTAPTPPTACGRGWAGSCGLFAPCQPKGRTPARFVTAACCCTCAAGQCGHPRAVSADSGLSPRPRGRNGRRGKRTSGRPAQSLPCPFASWPAEQFGTQVPATNQSSVLRSTVGKAPETWPGCEKGKTLCH